MLAKIEKASDFLRVTLKKKPSIAMITGTGLEKVTEAMDKEIQIPYHEIPHFPVSTAEGHRGVLVAGMMSKRPVIAMQGRFHLYEGYTPQEVSFPVRVMSALGVKYLLISSAAGGLNPLFRRGDLMLITDHINLTGTNPLMGRNEDAFGPRFPDMSQVYPVDLLNLARKRALDSGILLREGTYAGVAGPSLETPAETRFLRMIGADAVGMSTVPEAIVGVHCGMRIMAIAAITNLNLPDCMKETNIEQVIKAADAVGPLLARLWKNIIVDLPEIPDNWRGVRGTY